MNLHAQVQKLSYIYHLDGRVIPVINIFPPIEIPSIGRTIEKIPLDRIDKCVSSDIAPLDEIKITVPIARPTLITLEVESTSGLPRVYTHPDRCPICGAKLVKHADESFGRCLNRTCSGQMPAILILMVSALGLGFEYPFRKVFDCLNSRGALSSPVDIFLLQEGDFCFPNVSRLEVQAFQKYLHSIRGNTSLDRIINAIRVPGWSDDKEPFILRDYFAANKWPVTELPRFFDKKEQEKMPDIDWTGWNELLTVDANKKVITDLCRILRI